MMDHGGSNTTKAHNPEQKETETFLHENLNHSIDHLEESGLEALGQLRQQIFGENEIKDDAEKSVNTNFTLEQTLRNAPEQIHSLNNRIYKEVEIIRNALFG